MLARLLRFSCLVLGLAAIFLPSAFASEPRVALVIGNSDYGPSIGKLLNPANDARLMADTLKDLGFSVDLVLDADQKAMKRAIKAFGAKLEDSGKETTGLFYYAGHGVQVEGQNFLLPVGAEIEREADVEIESISADDVMTQMQFAGNAVNLVFLDACRNNPLAKANRSGTRGLARLDAPRGSFVGYSTAPGDVAADGDGANSPYALALAEELTKPGISVDEAHRNVRARVLAATGNQQTPWDSSSLTGAVVLSAKIAEPAPQPVAESVPAVQPAPTQQAVVDKEVVFWESIKASTDVAEFAAYLKKYPDGTFADLAKAKIAKLTAPSIPNQQPAQPDSPSAASQLVISEAAQVEIERYLRNVTTSKFWALAISRDGSRVEKASCPKASAGGGLGSCYSGAGITSQEQTSKMAVRNCGSDCTLLYDGDHKVSAAEIVTQSQQASLQAAPAPAVPSAASGGDQAGTGQTATAARVLVTADVKEQIERFIRNCKGGKSCYIAVSQDGSNVGLGKWDSMWGQYEVEAKRNAMSGCGGADTCRIIFKGNSLLPGVEIGLLP